MKLKAILIVLGVFIFRIGVEFGISDFMLFFLVKRNDTLFMKADFFLPIYNLFDSGALIVMFLTFLLVMLIVKIRRQNLREVLCLNKFNEKYIGYIILLGFLIGLLTISGSLFSFSGFEHLKEALASVYTNRVLKNTVTIALSELFRTIPLIILTEMVYRGFAQKELNKFMPICSAILVVLLFTVKLQFSSLILEIILCLTFYKTKSIRPSAIISFIVSIFAPINIMFEKLVLLYNPVAYETSDIIDSFLHRKVSEESLDFVIDMSLHHICFSAFITIIIIFVMCKLYKKDYT